MSLPNSVQQVVTDALLAMEHHPQHVLRPIHRQQIYDALTVATDFRSDHIYPRLALLSAHHVLPLWQQHRTGEVLPARLLTVAEAVLIGTLPIPTARHEAENAWSYFEHLYEQIPEDITISSYDAGFAAVIALFEVLGQTPFRSGVDVSEAVDDYLDLWHSDTAQWAAEAYAGAGSDNVPDPDRRRAFWTWWCNEALPMAWEAGK